MYAITIWQPWAWAILCGYKDVENRDWRPTESLLGQTIAIHAGKRVDRDAIALVQEMTGEEPQIQTGCIVGTARLVEVVGKHASPWRSQSLYGFVLADARRVEPIPCAGALNFWRLPSAVERRIQAEHAKEEESP